MQFVVNVKLANVLFLFTAVYLRSSPKVCLERLQRRGRTEEKPVTLVRMESELLI